MSSCVCGYKSRPHHHPHLGKVLKAFYVSVQPYGVDLPYRKQQQLHLGEHLVIRDGRKWMNIAAGEPHAPSCVHTERINPRTHPQTGMRHVTMEHEQLVSRMLRIERARWERNHVLDVLCELTLGSRLEFHVTNEDGVCVLRVLRYWCVDKCRCNQSLLLKFAQNDQDIKKNEAAYAQLAHAQMQQHG